MGKRLALILFLLAAALGAEAQYYAVNGACTLGGQATVTQGMASSGTKPLRGSATFNGTGVMASYPGCTVTAYQTGTVTPAQIFSTVSGGALSNPFTANLTDGAWVFFVPAGCYDVMISSGATQASTMPSPHTFPGMCAGAGGGGGSTGGNSVTVNGTQAVPNAYNFTNTLLVPSGSAVVNFLLNGNTVGAYVSGGGGSGGTFPTTPLYDLFASTGSAAAQFSGIKGANGFLQGQVLTSTGDVNSNPSPFPSLPNASVEYFPQGASFGGLNIGATNGLAAYFSHSANSGATHNGGLMLGGGNSSGTNYQVYVDCESSPLGCDFKVPISVNGTGVGSASLPTTAQYDLFASTGAGGAQASGVFGGPPGFLKTDVLVATGDITSVGAPFPIPPNASVEYFPQGGYGLGATNGLAAYISHSANAGANGAGGLALAGDSSDNIIKIYVDCETAPSAGCDFKVPITVNGSGVGGGGGISGVTSGGGLQVTGTTVGMLTTCGTAQYLSWTGAWTCTTLGTGVTTINGTAGAFTFSGSGVSCSGTNCTFGGGSSGVNTGTVNVLPKYVSTTTVGPSLLTDDGTTLTYPGTGGIAVSGASGAGITMTGTGGALTPVAGQGGIGIGPGGVPQYSVSGGAYQNIGSGGTGTAGVISINGTAGAFTFAPSTLCSGTTCTFPTSAILPTIPTYNLFASNGSGTAIDSGVQGENGFMHALASIVSGTNNPSPFLGANASQEWFGPGTTYGETTPNGAGAYIGHSASTTAGQNGGVMFGGGSAVAASTPQIYLHCETTGCNFNVPLSQTIGGGNSAIALSTTTPACVAQSNPTASAQVTLTVSTVAGDTVFVGLSASGNQAPSALDSWQVHDSGGSVYTRLGSYNLSGNLTTADLRSTPVGGAVPSTSVTITGPASGTGATTKYVACVVAYKGVGGFGATNTAQSTTNVGSQTVNVTSTVANSVVLSMFSLGQAVATSQSVGTRLAGAITTTGSAANGTLCQNTSATIGATVTCTVTTASNSSYIVFAQELLPGNLPVTTKIPHVVATAPVSYTDSTSITTPVTLCSNLTCPAGLYRMSYYANVSTACAGGTLTIFSGYTDSVGAKTVALNSTAFAFTPATASSSGSRMFQSTGAAGITYTTQSVACTTPPGGGTFWLTLEQLQ